MHHWSAGPDNWVKGAEQYAKGWIDCFHAYQYLGPKETHWSDEKFGSYTEDDLMKDVFEDGHVDIAIFQPTYLKEWYTEGFNTTERNAALGEKHPGKFIANTRFDPRDTSSATRPPTASSRKPRSSGSRTCTSTRGRRSGRWTRTRSTCPTWITRRPTSRSSTSSSSTSGCPGSRTSASWRRRSRTSTRACRW